MTSVPIPMDLPVSDKGTCDSDSAVVKEGLLFKRGKYDTYRKS
jgi:hypothetical protein